MMEYRISSLRASSFLADSEIHDDPAMMNNDKDRLPTQ